MIRCKTAGFTLRVGIWNASRSTVSETQSCICPFHSASLRVANMAGITGKGNKRGRKHSRGKTPFAQNLMRLMTERKLGVREAARIAGVSPSTLVSWRSGALPEDYLTVRKLAIKLGTTLSYLLTGIDDAIASGERKLELAEVFEEGERVFDGYAKITIQRMVRICSRISPAAKISIII